MSSSSSIKMRDKSLAGRIQHLILEYAPSQPLDGSCFHLNFSDTDYDQKEFARVLSSSLPLFALTPEEYELMQLESPSEMQRVAYDRITKNKHLSDYGEALLFVILDFFFDVPKFVTKVRARTSENVPVFGSDCAHVSFDANNNPVLWLGEAKFKEDFAGAVDGAVTSVTNLLEVEKLKSELRLLDPHVEANAVFDAEFMAKIRDITRNAMPIGSFEINIPVLLAVNSVVAKNSSSLDELKRDLEQECRDRFKKIAEKDWPVMNKVKLHFILFPLSDKSGLVEELRGYKS